MRRAQWYLVTIAEEEQQRRGQSGWAQACPAAKRGTGEAPGEKSQRQASQHEPARCGGHHPPFDGERLANKGGK